MLQKNQFGQAIGFAVQEWKSRQLPSTQKMLGHYCTLEHLNIDIHSLPLFEALKLNNAGETWTYLPFGPYETYSDFKAWLTQASAEKIVFIIFDSKTNTVQGIASYHDIDLAHGVIEVGSIHYSKALQHTRAATEAMYLMMCRVFEEFGYRRYQWRCNALNLPSRNAAERLGFKFEGIFRQSNVFKGCNRDTAWYSIIDSEWPALKNKFQKWLHPNNFDINGNQILKLAAISL